LDLKKCDWKPINASWSS